MISSALFSVSVSRDRIKQSCLRENCSCGVLDINNSTKKSLQKVLHLLALRVTTAELLAASADGGT